MNFSRLLILVGAATAAAVSIAAFPSSANALNFNFSFSNVTQATPGTVTGTVSGLVDNSNNSGGSPAVVTVTSAPAAASAALGTYTLSFAAGDQGFTVSGGNITLADWRGVLTGGNTLFLGTDGGNTYSPELTGAGFDVGDSTIGSSVTFTSAAVPFDIPGGATIPAVGGLLALGLMRKARKSLALNTRVSKPMSEIVS